MTGIDERAEWTALWRRWRATARAESDTREPDPLQLAAYAEHRLDEAEAGAIEAWLAANPEAFEDVRLAQADLDQPQAASAAMIQRALPLLAGSGRVLAFERPERRLSGLRLALAWGGMAASIAATGFVGFVLGSAAYGSFIGDQEMQSTPDQELFAPPTALFSDAGEESAI